MQKSKIILWSLLHSLGVLAYISIVATIMRQGNQWFGQEDKFITPVAVLLLLVISATITGSLVLGRPIMLYLENQKKDAVKLLAYTTGWLSIFAVIAFIILALLK